jgi:hypothetical protein
MSSSQRWPLPREATLTTPEQAELFALIQVYQQLWVRQSEALAEAVRRGLRAPLTVLSQSSIFGAKSKNRISEIQ